MIQKEIIEALPGYNYHYYVLDAQIDSKDSETMIVLLNMIFDTTIAIMMFLCFFSLSASMSANLYEQQKEIGIVRSIGITNWQIRRLYFYEAYIVVIAASILGMLTGVVIAFTMIL